jgi:putative transcriptional regulator
MAKKQARDIGVEILEGIREIKRGEVGRVTTFPPVAETRARVGLSQAEFTRLLGVSVRTLQQWEQGRPQVPDSSAGTSKLDRCPGSLL